MERAEPTSLHAVTLRTVRYNDRSNILWMYTRQMGKISVLVPAGAGRRTASLRAAMLPLSIVDLVGRQGRGGLMRASDMKTVVTLHSLRCDPAKIAVSMFIAEFLSVLLAEGETDERLFAFVESVVKGLEVECRSVANYHLAFLLGLLTPLGIAPDFTTYRPGRVFDMADAAFRDSVPLHTPHWLTPEQSDVLAVLSRMTLSNSFLFEFSRGQRSAVLDLLLRYYMLHYRALTGLRSLPVLRALYDD